MIFLFYDSFCFKFLKENISDSKIEFKILVRVSLDKFSISINNTNIKFFEEKIQYSRNQIINLIFYPIHIIGIFLYIFTLIKKFNQSNELKKIYLEGFIIFLCGLISIKLLKLKNIKLIYFCGDWFETRKSMLSKLFYKFFLFSDKIIMKNNPKVFYFSELIKKKRSIFNKQDLNGEVLPVLYKLNSYEHNIKKDIALIGNFKIKSILFDFIYSYRDFLIKNEIKLNIFGPESKSKDEFLNLIKNNNLTDLVIDHGYFNRNNLHMHLKGCFCGINLINREDKYSSNSINAKTVDYLSNYVVPITNKENITTAEFIKKYSLGYVVNEPTPISIYDAIVNIKLNYNSYKSSNLNYNSKFKLYNFLDH